MTVQDKVQQWLNNADVLTAAELRAITDSAELENRFYKDLEFGTGGLRGILGAGTNMMNRYTVRKASKGLADYLVSRGGNSVAVSYDSRLFSDEFARCAAEVFASAGLIVHVVKELMPTPFLSFAVRELKCSSGVMVTASHNPSKYNGYKVFAPDGGQLTDAAAGEVSEAIAATGLFDIVTDSYEDYVKSGMIRYIDDGIEHKFLDCVHEQSLNTAKGLRAVYTPLCGAGYRLIPKVLEKAGAEFTVVPSQAKPDGMFPTCPFPNPEKAEALAEGIGLLKKTGGDILIATDPDADRVGTAVMHAGEAVLLSGNELGALLTDYLLAQRKARGTLPALPIVIKTIVTTALVNKIAQKYGGEVIDVLTGFKYIGEQISRLDKIGQKERYIFGFEESYGYSSGTYTREKDAVVTTMLTAEMTAYYKAKSLTLVDRLNELYEEHGLFKHELVSQEYPGASGNAKMIRLLADLRANPPKVIGMLNVLKITDYMTQTETDLPKSNVLVYDLSRSARLVIRPSGTEPLIKIYLTASGTPDEIAAVIAQLKAYIKETLA